MKVRMSEDFIIRVRIVRDELQLLYIYDKSDFENTASSETHGNSPIPPPNLITN